MGLWMNSWADDAGWIRAQLLTKFASFVDNDAALLGLRWHTRKAATGGKDEDTRQKELDVGRVERGSHDEAAGLNFDGLLCLRK